MSNSKIMLATQRTALISFCLFAVVLIIIRLFLCQTFLSYDEAEQVVFAQNLSPGYPAQPPLYTWLQWAVFQINGINLFGLSFLKFGLIAITWYIYYVLCRVYCTNVGLCWGATLSWALMPNIAFDFLPHRTHVILALFASVLTWHWLIRPTTREWRWYLVFGVLIGVGILAKFNYLLFLAILLLAALSIAEYRQKIINPKILISLGVALCLSFWYLQWLWQNPYLGFYASYKLVLPNKNHWYAVIKFVEALCFFIVPVLLIPAFFSLSDVRVKQDHKVRLLHRYHLIVLPITLLLLLLSGKNNIRSHWLVPLLFLTPVWLFSLVTDAAKKRWSLPSRLKLYILICLFSQLAFIVAWVMRAPSANAFPLTSLIKEIKNDLEAVDYIVSDSHWLLGNLMLTLQQKGVLVCLFRSSGPVLKKKILLVWEGDKLPWWFNMVTGNYIPVEKIARIRSLTTVANRLYLLPKQA